MASTHSADSEQASGTSSSTNPFAAAVHNARRAGAVQLVFPAEVSAGYWRRRLARERGAVWSRSVVSWDSFKESHFGASETLRPANRLMRRIFAELILGDNASAPHIENLISPEYAAYSGRYAGAVASMLPALVDLLRRSEAATGSPDGDALRRDLRRIYEAYRAFLEEHSLFEPQWRRTSFTQPTLRTALIACDLATDYAEFAPYLENQSTIHVLPAPSHFPSRVSLHRYPGVGTELSHVLLEVERLLAEGVSGDEIAVTVGNLPALRDRISLEAARRGVPVIVRQGRPLSEYPGTALFRLMHDAASSSFTHEGVRELVLHRAVPWRDRAALRRELVKGAVQGRLRLDTGSGPLLELTRDIHGVVRAPHFREIQRRLRAFFRKYLDTDTFPGDEERAFQSALDLLSDLVNEEDRGLPPVSDPFGFFVSLMSDQQYVPRRRSGGVSVYSYRVSAGIQPRYHFLVNCSQDATKVSSSAAVQLIPESRHEALGITPYDVSDAMLRAYAHSGEHVRISVADRGPSGSQLPAGPLAAAGLIDTAEYLDGAPADDPFLREQRYLSGERDAFPGRVYPVHRSGTAHATVTLDRPPWMDRSRRAGEALPPREISATALGRYWNCPFGYFLESVCGVEDQEIVPDPADPRGIGNLYHRVLQQLYADIRDSDGIIEPSHFARYRERGREIAEAVLDSKAQALRDVARRAYLILLEEIAGTVVAHDVEAFPGYEVYGLEADYAYPGTESTPVVQEGLLRLTGRIDRVLRSPESGAVVLADYKRRSFPGKAQIRLDLADYPADRPGSIDPDRDLSLQMPAYVYLLERNGLSVEAALYYGLETAEVGYVYHPTSKKSYINREELDVLLDRIDTRLRAMPQRFAEGDFRVPNEEWGCASCRLRGVCRLRFTV